MRTNGGWWGGVYFSNTCKHLKNDSDYEKTTTTDWWLVDHTCIHFCKEHFFKWKKCDLLDKEYL